MPISIAMRMAAGGCQSLNHLHDGADGEIHAPQVRGEMKLSPALVVALSSHRHCRRRRRSVLDAAAAIPPPPLSARRALLACWTAWPVEKLVLSSVAAAELGADVDLVIDLHRRVELAPGRLLFRRGRRGDVSESQRGENWQRIRRVVAGTPRSRVKSRNLGFATPAKRASTRASSEPGAR